MADVQIRFGGDASGAVEAGRETGGAVENVGATVKGLIDLLVELGGAATGSFRQMGVAAREAGENVKGTAAAVKDFREGVAEIGEVLIAAFAVHEIEEFARKMGEAAEQTYHTALAFGLTTGQVQELKGQFTALGLAPEAGIMAMMRLDRSFATAKAGGTQQAEVFRKLGIDIHGAYTQSQLFEAAIQGLANVPAGPARVAEAMRLFGRNIQNIAPLLGMTKEQLGEVSAELTRYGIVNDDAEQKGLALAEAFNENKVAGQGLMNVLTEALAPAFTTVVQGVTQLIGGMIDSYRQGGLMKVILDALVAVLRVLETALVITGAAFGAAFQVGQVILHLVMDLLEALHNLVKGPVLEAIAAIQKAWSSISAPVMSVINAIIRAVTDAARAVFAFIGAIPGIGPAFRAVGREASAALQAIIKDAQNAGHAINSIWNPSSKLPALPKASTGTTADDPDKVGKAKKAKDDQIRIWEEQLHEQEVMSKDYFGDQTASELAFWQSKLALVKDKSKDWYEIQSKIFELSKALARQQRQEALEDTKAEADEKLSHLQSNFEAQKSLLQEQQEMVKASHSRGDIGIGSEYAQLKALQDQETALEKQHQDEIYAIKKAELDREAQLYATDPVNADKIHKQIEKLEQDHQDTLTRIDANGARARQKLNDSESIDMQKAWVTRLQPLQNAFDSLWSSALKGGQSFGQIMGNMALQFAMNWAKQIDAMLVKWIAQHITMTAVHTAATETQVAVSTAGAAQETAVSAMSSIKMIAHAAAVAAAKAYSALAGIPIIGPALGAVAAAVTFAAVIALGGGLASAAGGQDQVPDDGQITELHKDEMVLSAKYARPLRSMLEGADFGNSGTAINGGAKGAEARASGVGQGDQYHMHFMPGANIQAGMEDFEGMLHKNSKSMMRWITNKVRNGDLKLAGKGSR